MIFNQQIRFNHLPLRVYFSELKFIVKKLSSDLTFYFRMNICAYDIQIDAVYCHNTGLKFDGYGYMYTLYTQCKPPLNYSACCHSFSNCVLVDSIEIEEDSNYFKHICVHLCFFFGIYIVPVVFWKTDSLVLLIFGMPPDSSRILAIFQSIFIKFYVTVSSSTSITFPTMIGQKRFDKTR